MSTELIQWLEAQRVESIQDYHFNRRMVMGGHLHLSKEMQVNQAKIVVYSHAIKMAEEFPLEKDFKENILMIVLRLRVGKEKSWDVIQTLLLILSKLTRSGFVGHHDFYNPEESTILKDLHNRWLREEGWLAEDGTSLPWPSTPLPG